MAHKLLSPWPLRLNAIADALPRLQWTSGSSNLEAQSTADSTLAVAEDGVYGSDELAPASAQFTDALLHNALQQALALGKNRNKNLAAVFLPSGSANITVPFETVHKL